MHWKSLLVFEICSKTKTKRLEFRSFERLEILGKQTFLNTGRLGKGLLTSVSESVGLQIRDDGQAAASASLPVSEFE